MAGLDPPGVAGKLVPVFAGGGLACLERACAGRGFAGRRDAAIIAVLRACGIGLPELAGIGYDRGGQRCGDLACGSGRSACGAKAAGAGSCRSAAMRPASWTAALRARARHPQAWRVQLWPGAAVS